MLCWQQRPYPRPPCIHLQVYPEGRMSQTMDRLKIGDKLDFKGPKGRFQLELNEKRALGESRS